MSTQCVQGRLATGRNNTNGILGLSAENQVVAHTRVCHTRKKCKMERDNDFGGLVVTVMDGYHAKRIGLVSETIQGPRHRVEVLQDW